MKKMNKYLLIILLLTCSVDLLPQNVENLRVTYFYKFVGTKRKVADRMVLDIQKNVSDFYSIYRDRTNALQDSMFAKGCSLEEVMNERSKLPKGQMNYRVYKNYPKTGILSYIDKLGTLWYKYEEKQEQPVWTITSEKKELLGYACQKATAVFRGRTWIAWYTTAIPVNDGPWKLWGLPGLILEANDLDNIFRFSALGIKKIDAAKPIQLLKKQFVKCTRIELHKAKIEESQDAIAFMGKLIGKRIKLYDSDTGKPSVVGTQYTPMETDL